MTKLTLDKYLLINKTNYRRSEISSGFVLKNLGIIDFIKLNAITLVENERLDLISVIMVHLYGDHCIDKIINRFDLNKRKIKFLHFIRQIINLKINIKNNYLESHVVGDKRMYIFKLIWQLRCGINAKKQGLFNKDRISFDWYKLALLHILPFEKIKDIDFFEIKWPIFPLVREEIVKSKKTITNDQVKRLFFQAEDFWVNNNFQSSPKEISNFLEQS